MAVYVDNMRARYGRMTMCHMLADTEDELLEMAHLIGVQDKWHQNPGTPRSHFDICLSKRFLAVKAGAIEITMKDAAKLTRSKSTDDEQKLATDGGDQ